MSSFNWQAFLLSQVWQLPYVFVFVVGIILAIVNWQRHPTVSLLSLIAFLLFLGSQVLATLLNAWQISSQGQGFSSQETMVVFSVVGGIRVMIGLLAWTLLLFAIFGTRSTGSQKPIA